MQNEDVRNLHAALFGFFFFSVFRLGVVPLFFPLGISILALNVPRIYDSDESY